MPPLRVLHCKVVPPKSALDGTSSVPTDAEKEPEPEKDPAEVQVPRLGMASRKTPA